MSFLIGFALALISGMSLPNSHFGGVMPIGVRAYHAPESALHRMIADDDVLIHTLETWIHVERNVLVGCLAAFLLYTVTVAALTCRKITPKQATRPNQALQPTPLPVALLFFMSYPRVLKPRPQRRG
jgi:hypothetical protein